MIPSNLSPKRDCGSKALSLTGQCCFPCRRLSCSLTYRRTSSWRYLWTDECVDTGRICSTLVVLTLSFRLSAASLRNGEGVGSIKHTFECSSKVGSQGSESTSTAMVL